MQTKGAIAIVVFHDFIPSFFNEKNAVLHRSQNVVRLACIYVLPDKRMVGHPFNKIIVSIFVRRVQKMIALSYGDNNPLHVWQQKGVSRDRTGYGLQFAVFVKALLLGIPGPRGLLEFKDDFADVFADATHVKRFVFYG